MTVIAIPAQIPAFRSMESKPGPALAFANNLRSVTVGVKDVQGWASGLAAPDWQGDTGDTHDHVITRYAARLDTVEAALDLVVTAADRFEERLTGLHVLRPRVDKRRVDLNRDIEALRIDVDATAGTDVDATVVADLERRGEALLTRASEVEGDITDWVNRYLDAEADFIAALQGVDTLTEGERAADDPDRIDTGALLDRFDRLKKDPEALADWWAGLSRAEKQALMTEDPGLVGNTGGIPAADRDDANRSALSSDLDYLRERKEDDQLSSAEETALENAEQIRTGLEQFSDRLDPQTGRELAHVLVYNPGTHSGDGAVAISFGNPDTADHVSVNVPGLTSDASSTEGNLKKTLALHDAALDADSGSVASIYWLDYDAPSGNPINPFDPLGQLDFGGVAFSGKADDGGERFSDFIDGLRASDEGERAHVTAIGHSYGSTAVGHALEDGVDVDDAILIGSPGQPVSTADALTDADVWVGAKDYDPVSLLGIGDRGGLGALGHDPASEDFGAPRFETGDGSLRVEDLLGNHTSYFEGDSLDNMASIVTDNDADVTYQPARGEDGGGYLTLDELLVASSGASAGEFVWDHGGEVIYETGRDGVELVGEVGGWLLEHSRFGGIL